MSISICIFHEIYDEYEHLIYHNEIKQILMTVDFVNIYYMYLK